MAKFTVTILFVCLVESENIWLDIIRNFISHTYVLLLIRNRQINRELDSSLTDTSFTHTNLSSSSSSSPLLLSFVCLFFSLALTGWLAGSLLLLHHLHLLWV